MSTIAKKLIKVREEHGAAVKAAAQGDSKALAKLRVLRDEERALQAEFAVEQEVGAERARLNRAAAAAAERRRRREGLGQVDATFVEQVALAAHADALLEELGATLTRLNALGGLVVEQFRAHCPTPRLTAAFCDIGFQHRGLLDELLKSLWQVRPIVEVLRTHGCGAPTIHRPPSLEETVRTMQRRALGIVDRARADVAEPGDTLPPAA